MKRHSIWLKWDEAQQKDRIWCGNCKKFLEPDDAQHPYPPKERPEK